MQALLVRCLKLIFSALAIGLPAITWAGIWHDQNVIGVASKGSSSNPVYYRLLQADIQSLDQLLSQAPLEFTSSQGGELELPMPYGAMQRFHVVASPVMAQSLASRYPEIRTYSVRGIDEPASSGRIDLTPAGFHAMLSTPAGTVFIDPDEMGGYRSYYKSDYALHTRGTLNPHVCGQVGGESVEMKLHSEVSQLTPSRAVSGDQRRIYRLAVAATAEYTAYFGGNVASALAQIVTAVNRINQIYGRDLAVQFQLVGNNDRIIYKHPDSDPYTHTSSSIGLMLVENQQNLDFILGKDNYDIGHLFGTVGGGLASVSSACGGSKAQAYTGTSAPDSDVFYIDFVAHELGHQLGATHSFNGTTASCGGINRVASAAMEPGSGSTIMSYAGICAEENLQPNSDPSFHAISIQQMHSYITTGEGGQCGSLVNIGNSPPSVVADNGGGDIVYTIPASTPFRLSGSATDADGDTLSYQWDEMDAGGLHGATNSATIGTDIPNQNNPLFRSYLPKNTPNRYFPRLSDIINNRSYIGETLPENNRTLNFRLTVRDGESGVADDDITIQVNSSQGPFHITGGDLNASGNYVSGTSHSIEWTTAGTVESCPTVQISLLSLSAGDSPATFCDMSDSGFEFLNLGYFPNNGSAVVVLPSVGIDYARVMLACADNIYFDLSDATFQLDAVEAVAANDCKVLDGESLEHGAVFNDAGGAEKFDSPGGGGQLLWLVWLLGFVALSRLQKDQIKLPG